VISENSTNLKTDFLDFPDFVDFLEKTIF